MKKAGLIFSLFLLVALTFCQSAQAQRRWSPQAKDATIGAGIGGAAGAIINKRNRVVGGVIGGVLGGATGYAIGKHKDNVNKEAARVAAAREAERQAAAEREAVAERKAAAEREARATATAEANIRKPKPAETQAAAKPVETQTAVLSAAPTTPVVAPTAPVMTYSTAVSLSPELHTYYLPNLSFGDASTPYGQSKYRRKSW